MIFVAVCALKGAEEDHRPPLIFYQHPLALTLGRDVADVPSAAPEVIFVNGVAGLQGPFEETQRVIY